MARRITINMPEIPKPICRDQTRHPVDREHALGTPRAPHRPSRDPRSPRLPQPRMNPPSRTSTGEPPQPPQAEESGSDTTRNKIAVRLTSHERPAATRALPLLRHEPEPQAARPAPDEHPRPADTPHTNAACYSEARTADDNAHRLSIQLNPSQFVFSFETAGRETKTAGVTSGCQRKNGMDSCIAAAAQSAFETPEPGGMLATERPRPR